jgi:hypothetical protein
MKKISLLLATLCVVACNRHINHPPKMAHFSIPFETNDNKTLTYHEAIACYEKMAAAYPNIFTSQRWEVPTAESRFTLRC